MAGSGHRHFVIMVRAVYICLPFLVLQGPYLFLSLPNTPSHSPLCGGDGTGPRTGDIPQRRLYFKNESNLGKFCSAAEQNVSECNVKPLGWCLEAHGSTR